MLSKRLTACLNYLDPITVLYDVGTDHGYLAIEAIKQNIVSKAYAVDNKIGPLTSAKQAIKDAGLEDKIIPVLSDGIEDLTNDADGLVIAGLGGKTIVSILTNHTHKNLKRLVLQPNNNAALVRLLTKTNRIKIVEETLVMEDGIIYPIIVFEPGKQDLDTKDIHFGPILRRHQSPLFKQMIASDLAHLDAIIASIPDHIDKTKHLNQRTLMKEVLDDYPRRH